MKQQIVRFSLHQNAKVMANLMAINSLIFFIPFVSIAAFTAPPQSRPGIFVLLVMPVGYLIIGYVMSLIGCAVYNFLFKYIGGFEFESDRDGA